MMTPMAFVHISQTAHFGGQGGLKISVGKGKFTLRCASSIGDARGECDALGLGGETDEVWVRPGGQDAVIRLRGSR
jgi:hypothetical protein